jgi:hypothetical protein
MAGPARRLLKGGYTVDLWMIAVAFNTSFAVR